MLLRNFDLILIYYFLPSIFITFFSTLNNEIESLSF